jgi:UDP-2,3-diacylglucosamine hydrolase
LSKRILFISDLHLEESRPDITRTLLQFLNINSGKCAALYILGDLFEVWIGDDEQSPLIDEITSALRGFHVAGSSIYLMHGNRDFLIGDNFAKRCGAELIEDPCILKTEAGHIVLLHGDTLCTDDLEYMQFRAQVRQQIWQQEFLAKSLDDRRAFAQEARQASQKTAGIKNNSIMDVNGQAVLDLFNQFQENMMLHGHTHRPAVHELAFSNPINGQIKGQRIVLGDWNNKAWYAETQSKEISLLSFDLVS